MNRTTSSDTTIEKAREVIAAERHRQIAIHGFDAARDGTYVKGELYAVAQCYYSPADVMTFWPESWDRSWWKPTTRMRDLGKCGALLEAEIERCERWTSTKPWPKEHFGGLELAEHLKKCRANLATVTSGIAWLISDTPQRRE